MDVTPLVPEGRQVVHAWRPGGFSVTGRTYEGSVLVLPERTEPWAPRSLAEVTVESLLPIVEAVPRVEVLVLGSGKSFVLVPPALRKALRERGVIVEAMSTPAGCRTYNVLLVEDRRVAAALLAVES